MIPKSMESYLRERLPDRTWRNRLNKIGPLHFMEFTNKDVERLHRLDIEVDNLGPHKVICMWDEESDLAVGGYLVVDSLAMGKPSMGGIRMLPDLIPSAIHNLARGMTLKNAAANLPYGGGKSGIVADRELSIEEHMETVRGFARLIAQYSDIYLPGPDVGTNDEDMRTIAVENGLDNALSKPVEMGGNRIDQLGAAAGGVVIAIEALLEEMPRLKVLPQFSTLHIPPECELTVIIQGFGAVGAHAARIFKEHRPETKIIGVSDQEGYLFAEQGLNVDALFDLWDTDGLVTRNTYLSKADDPLDDQNISKFSNYPNDLLRESAFCLIPAAPIANYLDTDENTRPTMIVKRMGEWRLIVEGANTYSPDPVRKSARARMERAVYRDKGVLIATDYLVNSGGVIYAAQEHLIKTPDELRIPEDMLADGTTVENWLEMHAEEFSQLAETRRNAAREYRDEVIRRNMKELVDLLLQDPDMLPCEAAERISIRRIAAQERDRRALDIMQPIAQMCSDCSIKEAASELINNQCSLLAITDDSGELVGVVTEWDITNALSCGLMDDVEVQRIMTQQVISTAPNNTLLDIVQALEHHEISAMPVVDGNHVIGMVSSDLLTRRSLLRLLHVGNEPDG